MESKSKFPVVMTKGCHTLLCTVKEMQLVTTYEEVLEVLGRYIYSKKLYDFPNMKVCCKGDDLSSVVGRDEFAFSELSALLPKLAVPVSKDKRIETPQKKMPAVNTPTPTSPMYLRVPSSPSYCDKSDSVDSIQGYETAFVKDSSDDVSTESGGEKIFAVEETLEFECDSDSSTEYSSDSEAGEITNIDEAVFEFLEYFYYKPKPESDIEFFADASSDDDEQSDAEIGESDFWSCPKCSIKNKPTVRYCLKCFQQRRNWLPDKPKPPSMKRKNRRACVGLKETKVLSEASLLKCDRDSEWRNDASRVSCDSRENSPEPVQPEGSCEAELFDSQSLESVDSCGVESTPPSQTESVISGSAESLGSLYMESSGASSSCAQKKSPEKLCMLCCSNPVNASIIHGRFAHQMSCYECARRLKRAKKDCPVCRRTIDRVVIQVNL